MHAARSVARSATAALRAGARAQSAAAPAVAGAPGPSFVDTFFFDAPDQNSLEETFPGVPAISGALPAPTQVQVSKLPNGLTVVSQDSHRGASTVGVYVKGGSRSETAPGTAFAVEHLAFGATQKRSALKLFRDVDVFGGHLAAKAEKETVAYVASATRDALPELTGALAETLMAPKLEPWEVAEAAYYATAQLEARTSAPGAALAGDLHAAAFGEASGLGHQALPTAGRWGGLTTGDIKAYQAAHLAGANVVLAGVNVDHAALVEQADLLFLGLPAGQATTFAPAAPRGGEYITRTDAAVTELGLGLALAAPDAGTAAALRVLAAALGGKGGPRPFTSVRKNVLATLQDQIAAGQTAVPAGSALSAGLHLYSDAALFSLSGATQGAASGAWLDLATGALKDVAAGKLTEAEVARAVAVATLDAVGPLDGISGARDGLGASLLLSGKVVDGAAQAAALGAVTKPALEKAAAALLKSGVPGVALRGDASALPRFDALAASLL